MSIFLQQVIILIRGKKEKTMTEAVFDTIKKRRSIRDFTEEAVSRTMLRKIIESGIWAPSGLNNQPWRFVTVSDTEIKAQLAKQTHYSHIVLAAPSLIIVYLDTEAIYDFTKDCQAAGACIQNMLLTVEELGLGAVGVSRLLTLLSRKLEEYRNEEKSTWTCWQPDDGRYYAGFNDGLFINKKSACQ